MVKNESKWTEEVVMVTRHVLLLRRQLPGRPIVREINGIVLVKCCKRVTVKQQHLHAADPQHPDCSNRASSARLHLYADQA